MKSNKKIIIVAIIGITMVLLNIVPTITARSPGIVTLPAILKDRILDNKDDDTLCGVPRGGLGEEEYDDLNDDDSDNFEPEDKSSDKEEKENDITDDTPNEQNLDDSINNEPIEDFLVIRFYRQNPKIPNYNNLLLNLIYPIAPPEWYWFKSHFFNS